MIFKLKKKIWWYLNRYYSMILIRCYYLVSICHILVFSVVSKDLKHFLWKWNVQLSFSFEIFAWTGRHLKEKWKAVWQKVRFIFQGERHGLVVSIEACRSKGRGFESTCRLSLLNEECIVSWKTKNVSFEKEDRTCKTRSQIERVKQEVRGMDDDEGNVFSYTIGPA